MRTAPLKFLIAAALLSPLAACASGGTSTYSSDLRQVEEDCRARGGILQAIPGATSGRPAADNQCVLRGGPDNRLRTGE